MNFATSATLNTPVCLSALEAPHSWCILQAVSTNQSMNKSRIRNSADSSLKHGFWLPACRHKIQNNSAASTSTRSAYSDDVKLSERRWVLNDVRSIDSTLPCRSNPDKLKFTACAAAQAPTYLTRARNIDDRAILRECRAERRNFTSVVQRSSHWT